jgi:peptidyl-prolyl cis-trans isomerase D
MIGVIREKMQGIFAIVVVGVLSAVFALWGAESFFNRSSGSKQVALTVNGVDIVEQQISQSISVMRQRYAEMFKGKMDPSFLTDKMLREPAIQSLVSRILLEQQVDHLKMTAAPSAIDREIVKNPAFSQDGKTFDVDTFKAKLRSAGMTPAMYRSQMNDALVMEQLQQGIADSAFVTSKQVAAAVALADQTRSFEYLHLPLQKAIEAVVPDDNAIEKYYQEHAKDLMTEEKVTIEYLDLKKSDLTKLVTVDDADIRAAYDKEAAAFKPETERHAAHILIEEKSDGSEKAKLAEIEKQLKAGASFEALAKKYSDDKESAKEGGDVGSSAGNIFEPEFEKALAGLAKVGDVSAPIKTRYGYHFIKLLDKRETTFPPFEQRKPILEQQLRAAKADSLYSDKLNQMTDSTYSAGDLAGPAADLKMEVQKAAPFGRRGGAGVASQQKVIDAAFSSDLLDTGRNSQVIELSANRAVVIRVVNHQLPKQRDLAEVKPDIIAAIKKEKATDALKEKAQALRSSVQAGEAMAGLAGKEQLSLQTLENQKNNTGGTNAELIADAFKLSGKPTDAASVDAFQLSNGDWAVVHLLAIHQVKPDTNSSEFKAVENKMAADIGASEFSTYEQALHQAAKIVERKKSASEGEEEQQQ